MNGANRILKLTEGNARKRVLNFVEDISAAWVRGRLRELRAQREALKPKPAPPKPARPLTFGDEVHILASGKRESDARQKQWTRMEEHTSTCLGCLECSDWLTRERPRRVARLKVVAAKDAQQQIGIDRGQMSAHVGIPEQDVASLLESWGLS